MAYWKDLNPLDIDNSYTEYVISEMKYVDSDILSLEFDYITTRSRRLRFAFDHFVMPIAKSLRHGEIAVLVKPVQNKMMAYLQDFYPLDIDDSYTEYIISELKYDHNDFFLLDVDLNSEIPNVYAKYVVLSPLTSSHDSE